MTASALEPALHADVCIVCALAEEGQAVKRMFEAHAACNFVRGDFQHGERTHLYFETTIANTENMALTIVLSWPAASGELLISPKVDALLIRFRPRLVAMTGICAGDRRKVKLGDLIIAEKSFKYDAGKVVLDEENCCVLQRETDTKGPDADILEWLQYFEEWQPLLEKLPRPTLKSGQTDPGKSVRYIKAMAAGSAVRADYPFSDVQMPVRTAWAVEMESYAFYLAAANHRTVRALVVKGVCDYADPEKDDSFHTYASEASALYLLAFIKEFVTNTFMPPLQNDSPSGQDLPLPHSHPNLYAPIKPPDSFIKEESGVFEIYVGQGWIKFPVDYNCENETQQSLDKERIPILVDALATTYKILHHLKTMHMLIKKLHGNPTNKAIKKNHIDNFIDSVEEFANFLHDEDNAIRLIDKEFKTACIPSCFLMFLNCESPLLIHAHRLRENSDNNSILIIKMFLNCTDRVAKKISTKIHELIIKLLSGDNHVN